MVMPKGSIGLEPVECLEWRTLSACAVPQGLQLRISVVVKIMVPVWVP